MKKIFTLLVSVTLFASAFAQYKTGGDYGNKGNDVAYNDRYKKDYDRYSYSFSARERDMQIAQINREYDRKIMDVKRDYSNSRFRKDRVIRQLNDQRSDEIKRVYAKFNDRNNRYNDKDWKRH